MQRRFLELQRNNIFLRRGQRPCFNWYASHLVRTLRLNEGQKFRLTQDRCGVQANNDFQMIQRPLSNVNVCEVKESFLKGSRLVQQTVAAEREHEVDSLFDTLIKCTFLQSYHYMSKEIGNKNYLLQAVDVLKKSFQTVGGGDESLAPTHSRLTRQLTVTLPPAAEPPVVPKAIKKIVKKRKILDALKTLEINPYGNSHHITPPTFNLLSNCLRRLPIMTQPIQGIEKLLLLSQKVNVKNSHMAAQIF